MRPFWIVLLITLATASALHAQPLAVRSGDHPTFSRVTIALPQSQDWQAEKLGKNIVVSLPGHNGGFDVRDVFLRMRRDRIETLEIDKSSITLKVDCACNTTAFQSGNLLVVDVGDTGTKMFGPPINVAASASGKNSVREAGEISKFSWLPWIGKNAPSIKPLGFHEVLVASAANQEFNKNFDAQFMNDVQEAVFREAAAAASIGLLIGNFTHPVITETIGKEPEVDKDILLPKQLGGLSQNLRITNSMEQLVPEGPPFSDFQTSAIDCPDDKIFDVGSWGGQSSFSSQIGQSRHSLVNARDRLNTEEAKKFVRLYLYFGFGAEALNILSLDPFLVESNPELEDIATIIEYGAIAGQNSLAKYSSCSSDAALWAILSFGKIPHETVVNTKAALRALNKLPTTLRQILAPELSDRLLDHGDAEAASAAMRSITRLPGALGPDALIAQADIAIQTGDSAKLLFEGVIETNNWKSPEALVKLIKSKLDDGDPLSTETATLVEAYAQELRGTDLGNQLSRSQVLALGQSGQFDRAFQALETLSPSLSPDADIKLREATFEALANRASDIVLLEHTFKQKKIPMERFSVDTRLLLADRLMKLGFASQVQDILTKVPDTPRSSKRQLLAARAALALQQPFQAQAALNGIDDPEAAKLLAKAKELSGSNSGVEQLLATDNAAMQTTLLSNTPIDSSATDTLNPSASAAPSIKNLTPKNSQIGPLGRANAVLEESGAARATLQELLRNSSKPMSGDSQ